MSAYLDTRVSLYSARLLPDEALEELIELPDEAVAEKLIGRGLPQLAMGYDRTGGVQDSSSLEQRIIAQVLDETRVLIRPLSGDARGFLTFWTARFEMSNVKTLLRSKMTGERPAAILARLIPMGTFGRLDNEDLAHAEDVGELLRRLEAGPYAAIVRRARRAFEQSHNPFSLDAALDRGYYEGLVQHAQPLEETVGEPFRILMANLIDRINLVWLLRYRFNYRLPPAQVYYLLVASRYSLPSARLRELAALDSPASVLGALHAAWQARLSGVTDIPAVFAHMEHAAAEQAWRVLRSRASGIARAFAYLILRERDLRAVRAVLRGRHLGLADDDIRLALRRGPAELS
ncbi:MAG: V-type ATPase subunit [Thiobacillus sp.]|nr:V-type ATPase subunit [Thiobacillus sp.]